MYTVPKPILGELRKAKEMTSFFKILQYNWTNKGIKPWNKKRLKKVMNNMLKILNNLPHKFYHCCTDLCLMQSKDPMFNMC